MIGNKIKEVLKIRGMSQAALSKATGISKSVVSSYINHRIRPNIEKLSKISKALNYDFINDKDLEQSGKVKVPKWFKDWLDEWEYEYDDTGLVLSLAKTNDCPTYKDYIKMCIKSNIDLGYSLEEIEIFEKGGIEFSREEWKYIRSNFNTLVYAVVTGEFEVVE